MFKKIRLLVPLFLIQYAQQAYPKINFSECDIMLVDKFFNKNNFDLIYLMFFMRCQTNKKAC